VQVLPDSFTGLGRDEHSIRLPSIDYRK